MTDIIFHFGQQIGNMMYDYSIDYVTWNNLLGEMGKLYDINKSTHVIYQLDHLTYEFSRKDMTYVCYEDTTKPYDGEVKSFQLPMLDMNFSHIHYRRRQIFKCDFQPINTYYNVHEVVRYTITFPSYIMIFEEQNYDHTTYEIMYIVQECPRS